MMAAGQGIAHADAPAVLGSGHDGHRVDGDKVDAYAEATVYADGSWNAFAHTTPTGHWLGGCNRVTLVFYGENKQKMYATDAGNFCTGTRDGVGGPPDREDRVGGGAGSIPPTVIANTRYFAVVVSGGHHDTYIDWEEIYRIGSAIASTCAMLAG